ncbi:MAG: efflux RND transporter periplasmic adaptor subunit [Caldilineaceae bacterium]|nr:efflux RND transporter periplasmic adaptor subunit [Caldilineaceae bacterium]
MKRWGMLLTVVLGAIVLAAVGGFWFMRSGSMNAVLAADGDTADIAQVEDAGDSAPVQFVTRNNGWVEVDGRVVPAISSDLSMPVSGVIAEILVSEGDMVEAGQPLLRLRSQQQSIAVTQAAAQLQQAEARLAELKAGAREEDIQSALAGLVAAQARQNRLEETGPNDIAAAEANLAAAQASLQRVYEGTSEQQIIAARADLANAEASRAQAQSAYDRVKDRSDVGMLPESVQLQQATNAYNAALARLEDLQRGALVSDVNAATAQVRRAQAQLEALRAAFPSDVIVAKSDVQRAQAQFDLLAAGNRAETIAVTEAEVALAQARLEQAQAALNDTELQAPFAGTIAALNVAVGEQATAGAPVMQLADLTRWQIETEDLTELSVVDITEGAEARIVFDAIPGLEKQGQVMRVRPIGEDRRGDIVYTVIVDPAEQDSRLLWNMTAVVNIQAK